MIYNSDPDYYYHSDKGRIFIKIDISLEMK
jgi:hypothetical protein